MGVAVDPNDAFAYVTTFNNEVFSCTINGDHSLTSPCNSLGNPGGTFNVPAGIIVNKANTIAYITNSNSGTLSQCPLEMGIFSGNCTSTTAVGGNDTFPLTIVLDEFINQVYTGINNHLYLAVCPILAGGNLGACSELRNGAFNTSPTGVAILNNNAGIAYVYALLGNEPVVACAVQNDGTFSSCTGSTTSITFPSSAMAVTR
jgi:DNA-binding beta-propeller fold protein YncE